MEIDPAPVCAEFSRFLNAANPEKIGKDRLTDVLFARAARVILYLDGNLTPEQQRKLAETKDSTSDFLWDE